MKKSDYSSILSQRKFKILNRATIVILIFFTIYLMSVWGYMLIEGWSFTDSFFMTAITLSTVGYEQPRPLSDAGRYFTSAVIFLGMVSVAFTISQITSFIVEGQLHDIIKDKNMNNKIKKLRDHYIICGLGRIGINVFEEFAKVSKNFVVIEMNQEKIEWLEKEHPTVLFIKGNAEEDEVLHKANIMSAKALISTFSSDASNIFVVLTARGINPQLNIISSASEQASLDKVKRAGANHIISPTVIGGLRIASMALRPNVISFLDILSKDGDILLRMEEIIIPKHSFLVGKFLMDAKIPQKTDVLVLGLKHHDQAKLVINPSSMTLLDEGTILITYGNEKQIEELVKLVNLKKAPKGFDSLLA